jgi:hypothetical protein
VSRAAASVEAAAVAFQASFVSTWPDVPRATAG